MNLLRIHYIVTVLLTLAVALQLAMSAPMNFPVPVLSKRVLKILSDNSRKFVTVSKSLRVNARASKLRIGMAFFPVYQSVDRIQLESARYPGNFLTIKNGTLLVDVPSENVTSTLELNPIDSTEMVTLRNEDDCYVGFNQLGKAKQLCELSSDDIEVRLTLIPLDSAELKNLGLDEEQQNSAS